MEFITQRQICGALDEVPINRFITMVENTEESFLVTGAWKMIKERLSHPLEGGCDTSGGQSRTIDRTFELSFNLTS